MTPGVYSILNSSPVILPLNIFDETGYNVAPLDTIYFRAYNTCFNGSTSWYSNIISASCEGVGPPADFQIRPMYIHVVNNTAVPLSVKRLPTSPGNNECDWYTQIYANQSYTFTMTTIFQYVSDNELEASVNFRTTWMEISTVGRPNNYSNYDQNGNLKYEVTVTSVDPINEDVNTKVASAIYSNLYPSTNWWEFYQTGNNQFTYCDSTDYSPILPSEFAGCNPPEPHLRIDVDRTYYGPSFTLICTIDEVTP